LNPGNVSLSHRSRGNPQFRADSLADDTVSDMLGVWQPVPDTASATERTRVHAEQWQRIAEANRLIAGWQSNADLPGWQAPPGAPAELAKALQHYVQVALVLPDWADTAKIQRAEALFMDYGAMSCALLFCSSLPECYVIPDLAGVLHESGQLEQRTEHRIRMTAAMIFPVMLHGGLTETQGAGVAQVLKVRLIHALIRHMILRGNPAAALQTPGNGQIPALADRPQDMYQALYTKGWDTAADGLPCNQEELIYTLLTFGYVYLRSLHRLGLGLPAADEEAFLHTWNVVGHLLGIERSLMVDTMAEAERLFARIQTQGRDHPYRPDPRPALAQALMKTMEQVIPVRVLQPFPVLMTGYLCGASTLRALGLNGRAGVLTRVLFVLAMGLTRLIDTVVRWVLPEFSISRFVTRVLGYQFMAKVLMDQTRPLKLPQRLLNQIGQTLHTWSDDPKAPRWLNALEDRWTVQGSWHKPQPPYGSPLRPR
jgi:hypothetical protein